MVAAMRLVFLVVFSLTSGTPSTVLASNSDIELSNGLNATLLGYDESYVRNEVR